MDPNREYMNPLEVLKAAIKKPETITGIITIIIGILVATVGSKMGKTLKAQNIIAIVGSLISIIGTQGILQEIAKIQKTNEKPETEVFLELDYSGYIPDSYISDPTVKLEIYKKIAGTRTREQLERLNAEINDRFGTMPEQMSNLLYISELRIVCRMLDIYHMKERNGNVTVEFSRIASISIDKLINLIKTSNGAVTIDPNRPYIMNMKTEAISLKDKALFILEKLQRILP